MKKIYSKNTDIQEEKIMGLRENVLIQFDTDGIHQTKEEITSNIDVIENNSSKYEKIAPHFKSLTETNGLLKQYYR